MANFVYAFGDPGGELALVDPAFDVPGVLQRVEALGGRLAHVLATHGHADHIQGISEVRRRTGARVVAHASADHAHDAPVNDGDRFFVGSIPVDVIHTPGHRFDAVLYVVNGTHVLTGDTLFVGECGRVDLPGSDPKEMHESLLTRLAALPRDLIVCPGHDYGATPTSTLAREFETNHTLRPRSLQEFLQFMSEPS